MIVVDTSVWVDALRGVETPGAQRFGELVRNGDAVGITDLVRMELLQGIRSESLASELALRLSDFTRVALDPTVDIDVAAALFRQTRATGRTVRRTIDCLIAATCIRVGATLLHDDRDFDTLASCSDLRCESTHAT